MQTESISSAISKTIENVSKTFDTHHIETLDAIISTVASSLKVGNKVMLCGNGGSAADSQHIAAEFVGRFKKERQSYPAIALTTDTSILTAIGNDYGFENVFSRQVEGLGNSGDVLIGISTSGNSENVLRAFSAAKKKGITTIAFTGQGGGKMANACDILFAAETRATPDVQASHIIALHTMCEMVENILTV
jgi:D-sedoheptulose 7-phosphate isomerase